MADIVTVRIPELPEYSVYGDLTVNDKMPIWMAAYNKTVWAPLNDLRTFLVTGGGVSHPPVISGNAMFVRVSPVEAGGKIFSVPPLAGTNFILRRATVGFMDPAKEYEVLAAGGFKLLRTDDKLYLDETFELQFFSSVPTTTGSASSGSLFTGVLPVSANKILGPADMRKLIQIRATTNAIALTLPDLITIPDNAIIMVETLINNSKQHTINTQGGQNIYYGNSSHTNMFIGVGEILWLFKGEDGFYLLPSHGNFELDGNVYHSYKLGSNELVLDGSQVLRADYPRLFEWAQTIGGSMVTDTDWLSSIDYIGCFSLGNGTTTFRLPNHLNTSTRALKTLIGSDADRPQNIPGGYQGDAVGNITGQLTHPKGNAYTGGPNNSIFGNGAPSSLESKISTISINTGNSETRMKNIGLLPKIKC